MNMKQVDILAIGDIATDVFIKITEAEATCDISGEHCKLCLNYGGKIPYESSEICYATGNSSNVAISASRLGLKSALMTNMGKDQNGASCLKVLEEEKVDTNFVKIEKGVPTNYHYVLWYSQDRTILVKHEKYEYEWTKTKESEKYNSPSWVYLSSLGENSLRFHDEIVNYLKKHTGVKLAFSPGTFQIKLGSEPLKDIYQRTDLFLSNHEEAQTILENESEDIPTLLKEIYKLGPRIVVITDGIKGAYAYDGNDVWFMEVLPQKPVESTGAGDAFSSAFTTALILDKNISEALVWGSINAMSVVSQIGPQKGLMTREELEKYILKVPENYKAKKIN